MPMSDSLIISSFTVGKPFTVFSTVLIFFFPKSLIPKGAPANIMAPFAIIINNISVFVRTLNAEPKNNVSIWAIKEYTKNKETVKPAISLEGFHGECLTIKVIAKQIQAMLNKTYTNAKGLSFLVAALKAWE